MQGDIGPAAAVSRDTIVALSSGLLPSGVAVVRLTGPRVRHVVTALAGSLPDPRIARYGGLMLPDGSRLDSGLTLFFPSPHSFTGEDCAEFQLHGGRAVVEALLQTICRMEGCRLAAAGEFTRRAFENGKLSLLDAEATADIVNAETEAQRRFAVGNATGANGRLYADWRQRLIRARAFIEAELDFSDEGDVPDSVAAQVWADMAALSGEIARHAAGYDKAEILRDGYDVVLLGAPNAGKSSLLNALSQREAAIVTAEPGTTRDLIEVLLDLAGMKVRLTDTAGIRETEGTVERIGIERARRKAGSADLLLVLEDLADPVAVPGLPGDVPALRIGTKADLVGPSDDRAGVDFVISCMSGEGLPALLEEIGRRALAAAPAAGELVPWRLRHVELLQTGAAHIDRAVTRQQLGLELRSEELRLAADALGRISGAVDVEDLLDVVFRQFCIGK